LKWKQNSRDNNKYFKFCDECCGIYREEEKRQEINERINILQRKSGRFGIGRFPKRRKKQPGKNDI